MYESPQFLSLTVAMFSYVIFFPVSLISYTKPKKHFGFTRLERRRKKKVFGWGNKLISKIQVSLSWTEHTNLSPLHALALLADLGNISNATDFLHLFQEQSKNAMRCQ